MARALEVLNNALGASAPKTMSTRRQARERSLDRDPSLLDDDDDDDDSVATIETAAETTATIDDVMIDDMTHVMTSRRTESIEDEEDAQLARSTRTRQN